MEYKITEVDSQNENYWIEIISENGPNTLIGVYYRHPSKNNNQFMKKMIEALKKIRREKKKTIICGDFNFNLLNYDSDSSVNTFLNTLLEFSFQPCITEPTRITNANKPSLVDNIFINTFEDPISGNILEHISYDHLPNFVVLNHVNRKKNNNVVKRDKKHFNGTIFQYELLDDDLLLKLLNVSNTNEGYDMFLDKYKLLLDKHAPLKKLS